MPLKNFRRPTKISIDGKIKVVKNEEQRKVIADEFENGINENQTERRFRDKLKIGQTNEGLKRRKELEKNIFDKAA